MGHGRMHKWRQLRRNKELPVDNEQPEQNGDTSDELKSSRAATRSGHQVKRPTRYCRRLDSFPKGQLLKKGEVVGKSREQ